MTLVETETKTDEVVFVASAKLPDDLNVEELARLLRELSSLFSIASDVAVATAGGRMVERETVERVRYGSDFLFVVGVAGSIAAILGSVSYAYANFQKGLLDRHTRLTAQREQRSDTRREKDIVLLQAKLVELSIYEPPQSDEIEPATIEQRELLAGDATKASSKLPRILAFLNQWDVRIEVRRKDKRRALD